jgi:hypothetical protein
VQRVAGVALAIATLMATTAFGGAANRTPEVRHEAPTCLDRSHSIPFVACVLPRSGVRAVDVVVRLPGSAAEQRQRLKSNMPCYSIPSDRVFKKNGAYTYFFEVTLASGATMRSQLFHLTAAAGDCASAVASGTPLPTPAPPRPRPAASPAPTPAPAPGPSATAPQARPHKSGRGRALLLALGGGVAGGIAAVAASRSNATATAAATPAPTFDGRIAGAWIGAQTLRYPSGCVEEDRIQLRLNESSGRVQGTLTFTVSTCLCCAVVQGGDHVSGSWDGQRLRLDTTGGLRYDGSVSGARLEGQLRGMGEITGDWSATQTP